MTGLEGGEGGVDSTGGGRGVKRKNGERSCLFLSESMNTYTALVTRPAKAKMQRLGLGNKRKNEIQSVQIGKKFTREDQHDNQWAQMGGGDIYPSEIGGEGVGYDKRAKKKIS